MKKWFDDMYFNCKLNLNLKQYLKPKNCLTKKNYDLIEEHNFFEKLQMNNY
jgi:hypothetical protein